MALAVKIRLADALVGRDDERAHVMLAELRSEAGDALDNLRDLARGIYPPLLADKGLAVALEGQARRDNLSPSRRGELRRREYAFSRTSSPRRPRRRH